MRRVLMIFFVLVVLAGLALGGIRLLQISNKETTSETFTITPSGDTLTIENDNGLVTVTAAQDDTVRVTRVTTSGSGDPTYLETPNAAGDRLGADCPFEFLGQVCEVTYEVALPAGMGLTVNTSSGDIRVSDVEGPLSIDTSSGGVAAQGVRSDDVRVKSSSGDIELAFADEPTSVTANSSSGGVRLSLPAGESYAVSADSSSGDINIGVTNDANAAIKVDVSTSSGDIEINNG